jgi:hypothetical protein
MELVEAARDVRTVFGDRVADLVPVQVNRSFVGGSLLSTFDRSSDVILFTICGSFTRGAGGCEVVTVDGVRSIHTSAIAIITIPAIILEGGRTMALRVELQPECHRRSP